MANQPIQKFRSQINMATPPTDDEHALRLKELTESLENLEAQEANIDLIDDEDNEIADISSIKKPERLVGT